MNSELKLRIQFFLASAILLSGCITTSGEHVVVYTSRDKYYAQPVLDEFEKQTGIRVLAVYDTGATKTAGLVNRIMAEKDNPQADVFWNSETARTIILKNEGLLAPYKSPNGESIPDIYKDSQGYWHGFGARARVIMYNVDKLAGQDPPDSIHDFVSPKWTGKLCVGKGWLGTMATHNSAIFLQFGVEKATKYFEYVVRNKVDVVVGNTAVRDMVSSGQCYAGLIDTSDAFEAIHYGKNVGIVYPDQGKNDMGTLIIPNTVALIKDSPNSENGKKFIDFMLSEDTEKMLAYSPSAQIPLRDSVSRPQNVIHVGDIKTMDVDYEKVAENMKNSNEVLLELMTK